MNDKDDRLKKLLQRAELDKPGDSFTEGVMAEIQSESVFNPALKSILKSAPIETPGEDFTQAVMNSLGADLETPGTSIISKRAWYAISGFVVIILASAFFGKSEINHSVFSYASEFGKMIHAISAYLGDITLIFILCLSSISCLLLLDYFLKERVLISRK